MRDYLKKNWINILLAILAALGGADAAAGVKSGKSPTNLTVLPSILAAIGSSGALGIRWLNSRTIASRTIRQGIPPEILEHIEAIYGVAECPDVTPEHAGHLADVAASMILGHYRRYQTAKLQQQNQVVIQPVSPQSERIAELERQIAEIVSSGKLGGFQTFQPKDSGRQEGSP